MQTDTMAATDRRYGIVGLSPMLFKNLQLFGEGGDGGAGAAPGSPADGQAADPGVNVPAPEERKGRRGRSQRMPVEFGQPQEQPQPQPEPTPQQPAPEPALKRSYDEIKKEYKDEIGADIQNAVQNRFKNQKQNDERSARMEALLLQMGSHQYENVSKDGKLDLEALEKAVSADDSYYQKAADAHGWSAETERYVSGLEKIAAQKKADDEQKAKDAAMYEEYLQVKAQAEQAKKLFPSLDLNVEMSNPDFARLIRAHVPVETAYKVIHADEITAAMMQHTAQQQAMAISNTIQAGQARPSENGLGRTSPANITRITDPRQLTREQRKELRRRAARGEKIVW